MSYIVTPTELPDVLILKPEIFGDDRGFFFESFNAEDFRTATGRDVQFVQDNHSLSRKGVLRGLHFQIQHPQGKLVRVAKGEVFDVVVDIRKSSANFGSWVGIKLSEENKKQLWAPEGFAHGFLVLSDVAEFLYKTTDYYNPILERCISWDDPDIGITWPLDQPPIVSEKDQAGMAIANAEKNICE